MKADHSIQTMCAVLTVSPSGYYAWCQRRDHPGPRAVAEQTLAGRITTICAASRQTYGSPRVRQVLRQQGHRHGRKRVARVMRVLGLCGRQKGRYRVQTTQSNHDQPIAPNHLATAAPPTGPNQIWVTDITFIETGAGWLYLAAVLDLYSRKIVGWAMSHRIDTALVLQALTMACLHRRPPATLLCHSDRGVQYAALAYRRKLALMGAIASMSRTGNCYDNATMESFWSTLKWELIYRQEFVSHDQARSAIFDYIECFYNPKRLHSALNFLSPVDFETKNN
jgi:transposase InsO family protein